MIYYWHKQRDKGLKEYIMAYSKSYAFVGGKYIYFDKLIATQVDGRYTNVFEYKAYGDGAHLTQTYHKFYKDGVLIDEGKNDYTYHNMQLESVFNRPSVKLEIINDKENENE